MNIRRFVNNEDFSCNMYIVSSEKGNFLVDPGFYNETIHKYIDSIGGIRFVLLTHGHFDHIGGMDILKKDYPDLHYYAFSEEADIIYSDKYNCSKMFGDSYIPSAKCDFIAEGKIKIGNHQFEVIHTPGHTKGSVIYLFRDEKIIFTGDTILGASVGRTDLPSGRESDLFNSLQKIKELSLNDDYMLYFGHEKPFNYGILKKINSFFK